MLSRKKYDFGIEMLEQIKLENGILPEFLSPENTNFCQTFHSNMEGYMQTPMIRLKGLAEALGVKEIFIKDESRRFGLNAFKGLGGSYALYRVVCKVLGVSQNNTTIHDLKKSEFSNRIRNMVFITATDGNHGKGIAWAASQLGAKALIFMPKGSSQIRAEAIRKFGDAEVTITELSYDDTVRYAARLAEKNGWFLIQDTAWEGYEEVPGWIMQGYSTMAWEAAKSLDELSLRPSHVFLQAGVGAMAGGVIGWFSHYYKDKMPIFSIVEPLQVACIHASMASGSPSNIEGVQNTIMAGLNCGEPCSIAWPIIRDFASFSFACADGVAALGMRLLAAPLDGDSQVISGESGAVTAGLVALIGGSESLRNLRNKIELNKNSVILLFNTEGNTDPDNYNRIVYAGTESLYQ